MTEIISRERELNQIKKILFDERGNVLLHGVFGSGKTSIAWTLADKEGLALIDLQVISDVEEVIDYSKEQLYESGNKGVLLVDEAGYFKAKDFGQFYKWIQEDMINILAISHFRLSDFITDPKTNNFFKSNFNEIVLSESDLRDSSETRNPIILK